MAIMAVSLFGHDVSGISLDCYHGIGGLEIHEWWQLRVESRREFQSDDLKTPSKNQKKMISKTALAVLGHQIQVMSNWKMTKHVL